jgi:hypothetical protein
MNVILKPLVVYVSRYQDRYSFEKFSRFVESYKKHPSGVEHHLIIIRKGFEEYEYEWAKWIIQLEGISYEIRSYPDEHYVFGYLRLVMEDFPDQYILFCMATTEILIDNWLYLFMTHAQSNRILGCSGSYESFNSNFSDKNVRKLNNKMCPRFSVSVRHSIFCSKQCPYRSNVSIFSFSSIKGEMKCKLYRLLGKKGRWEKFCIHNFYPFPNPALCTTGFMVPPRLLESIYYWPNVASILSKNDEFLFESGKYSLTVQALHMGYEVLVVGADSKTYSLAEWRKAKTFRSYNQENLIIANHHHRCYTAASDKMKRLFEKKTYGTGDVDLTSFWEQIQHINISEIPLFFNQKNV